MWQMTIEVRTRSRQELVEITDQVGQAVQESRLDSGVVHLFCLHTTAGLTVNENADEDVVADLISGLDRMVQGPWRHREGNSPAHLKASLVGHSLTLPVEDGQLCLGTWQGVFLCEFDGPRTRRVLVRPQG